MMNDYNNRMPLLWKLWMLFLGIPMIPSVGRAEDFITFAPTSICGGFAEISRLEQMDDGILAITDSLENALCDQSQPYFKVPTRILNVNAPSIALNQTISKIEDSLVDRIVGRAIYDQPTVSAIVPYDYSRNGGWVNSYGLGWINLKAYPWIWHPQLKWLHLFPAAIRDSRNSYWFWSEKYGWFWSQKEIFPKVWLPAYAEWRELLIDE